MKRSKTAITVAILVLILIGFGFYYATAVRNSDNRPAEVERAA